MNSILQQIITEMMTSFGNSAFDLLTGKLDFANLVIETQKSFRKDSLSITWCHAGTTRSGFGGFFLPEAVF
ncbi:hypothetical protein LCAUCD174_2868 [Lacticaseibacillus paracasei]|uniref:hypothetical protein n=1 Tax=Lacticaseibacillus paracasei TaxID=1597 RepID=UPI0002981DEC|nr:hypothetical protein [Lacticaseibacillus paracasei]EKQ16774.1 hypothetical protein LCAUCD174_2868 [Lacticaseibacillus paracasei]